MPTEPRSLTRMKVATDPSWAMDRIFELEAEVARFENERREWVHERLSLNGPLAWWQDFSGGDSITKRLRVAHYHLRIAQEMADGRFGGPQAPRRTRRRLARAQSVVIKLLAAPLGERSPAAASTHSRESGD